MPISGYRYAGDHLAQAQGAWDVQHQNMGMLELNVDRLVPGAKGAFILALKEFTVPGRAVGKATLEYLNGRVHYATAPEALGELSVTFRDFPHTNVRGFFQRWFSLVYDEGTGLMLPMGAVKTTGSLVLFQTHGTAEREWDLEGIWPTKLPDIQVTYGSGEVMEMSVTLSVDRCIPKSSVFNQAAPRGA